MLKAKATEMSTIVTTRKICIVWSDWPESRLNASEFIDLYHLTPLGRDPYDVNWFGNYNTYNFCLSHVRDLLFL